jgi:hypothetical protein
MLLCVLADTGDAMLWERMLDALDAVSPLVDDVRVGVAYLDMRGMPGNARRWIADAREALASYGVSARIGAGKNKFTAYAAGRVCDGTICEAGGERAFLAPLPIDLLEIDTRVRERLRLLGVTTLGALARLPHGAFVRRFGPTAARWHACACGEDRSPFLPRAHAVAIEAATFGEGRVEEEAQLFFALRVVLARVCADLERCGKRAGALELALELEDGTDRRIEIALASPSAHEKTLGDVVRAKMTGSTFSCAIVGLRLRTLRMEEGGEALPIFPADDVDPRSVAVTLARLEAVTGEPPRRALTRAAHALERRFAYEPFHAPRSGLKALRCHPEPVPCHSEPVEGRLVPQLQLLAVREIDVRLCGGAPAFVDSRKVVECKGPWRIEEGWFTDTPVARDEYDVLLDDDKLVRIYRQGRHWYLRGEYD